MWRSSSRAAIGCCRCKPGDENKEKKTTGKSEAKSEIEAMCRDCHMACAGFRCWYWKALTIFLMLRLRHVTFGFPFPRKTIYICYILIWSYEYVINAINLSTGRVGYVYLVSFIFINPGHCVSVRRLKQWRRLWLWPWNHCWTPNYTESLPRRARRGWGILFHHFSGLRGHGNGVLMVNRLNWGRGSIRIRFL